VADAEKKPRKPRKGRLPGAREEDPVFAGVVVRFAEAVREMVFGPPPEDQPPDDAGMAGSRVPRRPICPALAQWR